MTQSVGSATGAAPGGSRRTDRERVQLAIQRAVARWRQVATRPTADPERSREPDHRRAANAGVSAPSIPLQSGVLASLPRRRFLEIRGGEGTPLKMPVIEFRLSRLRALRRMFVWFGLMLAIGAAIAWDWMRGRDSPARRAARLRRMFERAGGTFIKVGRYLAMRLDLLPWEYGIELSRLLDRAPPLPIDRAVASIERATGRPLAATFARFDPNPVGSSSVSCVYQAVLHNGEKVVVKVRRPRIGELFTADLKVFDWLATILEFLTVLRPGRTESMRSELRDTLLNELDFVQAARQQDSFRRAARKSGKRFFTSPRVYFELSNDEVITQEFVTGMWLWELLGAIEQDNEEVLGLARRLKIDRRQLARRLAWVNYWGWHEHLFFRADPHPDGVIIGPGGKLTFIDFGSVDAINRTKRRALEQNMYYAEKRDPLNMARASLVLLEPLPPVDIPDLTRELENHNWEMLYAFESRPSPRAWSERTFARQWFGLFQQTRKRDITIDFSILRLLRVNVLYDTLVVRLDPDIDVISEYRRFARDRSRRVQERGCRRLTEGLLGGVDDRVYLKLERLAGAGEGLLFRLRQLLVMPRATFSALIGKWSFAAYMLIVTSAQVLLATALAVGTVAVARYVSTAQITSASAIFQETVAHRWYQWLVVVVVFLNGRRLLFRMADKEV